MAARSPFPSKLLLLALCLLLPTCFLSLTTASPVDTNKLEQRDEGNARHAKRQTSSVTLAPARGAPLSSMWSALSSSRLASSRSSSSTLAPVRPSTTRSSGSTLAPVRPSTTSSRSATTTRRTSTSAIIGTGTTPSGSPTSVTVSSAAASSTNYAFASNILRAHNSARGTHGASALTWSSSNEALAKTWAERCVWQHGGAPGLGQNLASSAGYRQSGQQVVDAWMSEERDYDPSNPTYSHFTQVVWKATRQVGCYQAACTRLRNPDGSETFPGFSPAYYTVCNYSPPGNVAGQFDENVEKII